MMVWIIQTGYGKHCLVTLNCVAHTYIHFIARFTLILKMDQEPFPICLQIEAS